MSNGLWMFVKDLDDYDDFDIFWQFLAHDLSMMILTYLNLWISFCKFWREKCYSNLEDMATEPLLGYELLTMGGGQLMALTLQMAVQCKAQNLLRNCQTNGWMDEWWYSSRTMWFFAYPIYLFNSIYFLSILMHFLKSLAVRASIPRTPLLLKAVARSYHLWRRLASKHVATGRPLSQWTEEISEEGKRPCWLGRCNVWSWTIKPSLGSPSPSYYFFLTPPALKEGRVPERLANFLSMAQKGRQALCTKKIQETHNLDLGR